MKSLGRISSLVLWPGLSLALGLAAGAFVLGLMLAGSDGTEPRGVCEFVSGDTGLLPLDPNEGGTYSYSCNLNITLAAFYVLVPGMALSVLVYLVSRTVLFAWRSFAKHRSLRNDGQESASESSKCRG